MTVAIVVSLVAMALTILGLVVKITMFTTTIDVYVKELRRERKLVMLVPMLEMRIGMVEHKLGMGAGHQSPFIYTENPDNEDH